MKRGQSIGNKPSNLAKDIDNRIARIDNLMKQAKKWNENHLYNIYQKGIFLYLQILSLIILTIPPWMYC